MTIFDIHADFEGLTFQVKRLADLLEEWIHPPPTAKQAEQRKPDWEITRFQPRSRWEAEREDRAWRNVSEDVAGVMPRK